MGMRKWGIALAIWICLLPAAASAYVPDVSELTSEELLELNGQIVQLLGEREDVPPFTLPAGIWTVGVNLPEGTYDIAAQEGDFLAFYVESAQNAEQRRVSAMLYSESYLYYQPQYATELKNVELLSGTVVRVLNGEAVLRGAIPPALNPADTPEPTETPAPTPEPTAQPTPEPTPQPTPEATPTPAPTLAPLKAGDSGEEVLALQERLRELGYLTAKADGIFGLRTKKAVQAFQEAAGLEGTGIADHETRTALFREDAKKAGQS